MYTSRPNSNLIYNQSHSSNLSSKQTTILVLDLDETLIHSEFRHPSKISYLPGMPPWNFKNEQFGITGYVRPHLDEFFEYVLHNFTHVGVWTAAKPEYARYIVDHVLAPLGFHPKFLLTSDDCIIGQGQLVKPLSKLWTLPRYHWLNANSGNTLIIDDRPPTAMFNPDQLMQINPFHPRRPSDFTVPDLRQMIVRLSDWLQNYHRQFRFDSLSNAGRTILNTISRFNFPQPYPNVLSYPYHHHNRR